jgi:hypothetical protein
MALYCGFQLRSMAIAPGQRSGRMTIEAVSCKDLEEQLETIRALAPGGAEGVFGAASVIWRVDREARFSAPRSFEPVWLVDAKSARLNFTAF